MFPDSDITGLNSNTAIDPSLEYSTDKVVLFWQTPSNFSTVVPFFVRRGRRAIFVRGAVEKTRLFKDHSAVELIMSLTSPSTRKRIGRGALNYDSGACDRVKKNAL